MKNDVTGDAAEITDYFVHCNLGWDGGGDGYYRSCIFNATRAAILDEWFKNCTSDYAEEAFYRYNLYTISHISHAK